MLAGFLLLMLKTDICRFFPPGTRHSIQAVEQPAALHAKAATRGPALHAQVSLGK